MGFANISSPADCLPGSLAALHVVAGIARDSSASLVLAHVRNPRQWVVGSDFRLIPRVPQNVVDSQQAGLARWLLLGKELGAHVIAIRFLAGTPSDQIARNDRAVDPAGPAGKGANDGAGLARVAFGSVAT